MSNSTSPPEYRSSMAGFKIFLIVLMILIVALMIWMTPQDGRKPDAGWGLPEGEPMPEIVAEGWINGSAPTPEKLNGQVVVIEAWATWCGPCLVQLPELKKVHEKYGDQVLFIGLTSESSQEAETIREYVKKHEIPWLIGYGANETLIDLQAERIPLTWVVGRDGKIVWKSTTDFSSKLDEGIEKALAGNGSSSSE